MTTYEQKVRDAKGFGSALIAAEADAEIARLQAQVAELQAEVTYQEGKKQTISDLAEANDRCKRRQIDVLQEQVTELQALSVTHIMTAVVLGEDGMGDEVYAKSVADVESLLSELGERAEEADSLQAQADALRHERDHARASKDNAVKLLVSIHSLLYPAPVTMADGRTMVFRPKSPDPHEVLQELSDRIRALPDELAALAAAGR